MMLPVQSQSVARAENAALPRDITQILQPNVEQSARVVNVRQDPVSPTLFRISLEIGNHRLDVMTNRPLAEGLTVLLSRDARGDVALRLPLPATAAQTSQTNQAQSLNQLNQLGGQANQFIAMIAPESRAQAQQLLTQTQMTALVQPQLTNPGAVVNPVANRAVTPANQSGQSAGSSQGPTAGNAATSSATPTGTPTSGTSTASSSTSSPANTANTQPQAGSAAAQSAAVNRPPVEALSQIRGQAGQNTGQQSGTGTASNITSNSQTAGQMGPPATPQATSQTTQPGQSPAATGATPTSPNNANVLATASASSAPATPANTAASQTPASAAPQSAQPATPSPAGTTPAQAPQGGANQTVPAQTNTGNQTTVAATQASQPAPASASAQSSTQTGLVLAKVVQSIEPNISQPNFARATLNIGGETLNIVSPRPLLAGQQIEVTRLNDQTLQVRLLPPQPVKTMPAEVVEEMQALLRQATPMQAPLADSLNQMRALSRGQSQDAVGQIVRSLMSLFSVTPQAKPEASAKQVEQMMQQSGLFTENRLARQASGQPLSVEDLRTRLGQLRRASQELPVQVRDQMNALIDKAEARATHQQINSARQWRDYPDGSAERYFRMDLPLQTPEGFKQVELELREQRRPVSTNELQTNWTLNLHFDLNPIGAVDARVHLEDEWEMSLAFWAESNRTTEMIRDRLEGFSSHLEQQGFKIDAINVRKGRAPNDLAPVISKHLVDVHT